MEVHFCNSKEKTDEKVALMKRKIPIVNHNYVIKSRNYEITSCI